MTEIRRNRPERAAVVEHPALRLIPYPLMVVSLVATAGTLDWGMPVDLEWAACFAAVVLAYRWWGDRRSGLRAGWFWSHLVLCAALVSAVPFTCIYAFTGYVDAQRRLPRRQTTAGMIGTATVVAIGQTGGLPGVIARPWLYLVLFLVNAGLGALMTHLGEQRERDVDRREEAVKALEAEHRRTAALQEQLLEQAREAGVLDERARLSREIHDTVAQGLIGIITQLEAIDARGDRSDWQARVEVASRVARDSLAEARRAIHALGSPALEADGLPTAIERTAQRWAEINGVAALVHIEGPAKPTAHDETLLRVAQEGLANVARHAGASQVALTLTYDAREVRLDVRDDGRGFDAACVPFGAGLRGMRARIAAVGGSLEIETAAQDGCTVSAAVPG